MSRIQEEVINDICIKPVVTQRFDPSTVVGHKYFPNPYNSVAMISRTRGGKTTVIYRVLEATLPKKSRVTIFCPSYKTDSTYKKMIRMLKEKDCDVKAYDHFLQGKRNILEEIVDESQGKTGISSSSSNNCGDVNDEKHELQSLMFNGPKKAKKQGGKRDEDEDKPENKKKKLSAEHVLIIDDLSAVCRHPSITRLLCKSRHLKMRIFISLHAVTNLTPSGLLQISNLLLFPNINREKIEEVADKCGISFRDDSRKRSVLWELYEKATLKPFNFLNIDRQLVTYKQNFNKEYHVDG